MLKRTHLRHFAALADTGSFTAAARQLNVTQPTLSASIAELERIVGTPLALRERRGIRLTEAGHRLLDRARTIEREFRAAESTLAPANAPLRPLRLGVLPSVSTRMLSGLAAGLADERPLALVEGSDADLRRRLAERQIDAALTLLRRGEPGDPVLEEGYAVLMARGHPLAARAMLDAEELAGETMIARRSCELLATTSKFFTARGVRPHFLLRSANEERCLALVAAGHAITTGPVSLSGGDILAVPLRGYDYRRAVGLVGPEADGGGPLATAWAAQVAQARTGHPA